MNESFVLANSCTLRVLIVTQSVRMGTALASLLGEPCDISYEIVSFVGDLPLNLIRTQALGVDVLLLDLEPWPVKVGHLVRIVKSWPTPVLVLALAHGVDESMHRQCRDAGVDHLLDRTADLGRLQSVITAWKGQMAP